MKQPVDEILVHITYVSSEGSDESMQMHGLIRPYAPCMHKV